MTKSEKTKEYNKTKIGVINRLFNHQIERCKTRGDVPPKYTRKEFTEWILSLDLFDELYINWCNSGYMKHLKPSIDRLDNYKTYSFDNIELVTWEINNNRARADIKNGILTKHTTTVYQYSKDKTVLIQTYPSIAIAARSVNGNAKAIMECLRGTSASSKGFYWSKTIIE